MTELTLITFDLNGEPYSLLVDGANFHDITRILTKDNRLLNLNIEALTFREAIPYFPTSLFLDFNSVTDLFGSEVLVSLSLNSPLRRTILSLIHYHVSHNFLG